MDTIVSKFRAAYEARDVDALGRMYKTEAELSDPFGAPLFLDSKNQIQGRKSIKEYYTKLFSTLPPDRGIKVIRRYEGDTYSVMEYEDGGMIFCACFEIEEGLVKKQRNYWGSMPGDEILKTLVEKSGQILSVSSSEPIPQPAEPPQNITPPTEPEPPIESPPQTGE